MVAIIFVIVCHLMLPGDVSVAAPGDVPAPGDSLVAPGIGAGDPSILDERLSWSTQLDGSLGKAADEYRPLVIFFHADWCPWCRRTHSEVFTDPAVRTQLEHFVRVQIDIDRNPEIARKYGVQGVPALRVLSSNGTIRNGADQFVTAPQLVTLLRGAINSELLKLQDQPFLDLLDELDSGEIAAESWPQVMLSMGDPVKRGDIRERLLKLQPFPRKRLVSMLENERLPVRLGALEVLEELTGDPFGYDPWRPKTADDGLERWRSWAGDESGEAKIESIFATMTAQEISGYLRDLIGENRDRATRAAKMIGHGGDNTVQALRAFLADNEELPASAQRRVYEILYSLQLPTVAGQSSEAFAHRLVFGNLDARLTSLKQLQKIGADAVPVFEDFLKDPEPLVRESAVEGLLAVSGIKAVPTLSAYLETEKDGDLVHAVLRGFSKHHNKATEEILRGYLENDDEDLVLAALSSLQKPDNLSAAARKAIGKCLADSRWRVRAGALETVTKKPDASYSEAVLNLVDDEDDFVRYAAIQALASLKDPKTIARLEPLFLEEDELKGPIVGAYLRMDAPFPESFRAALDAAAPDTVLSVLAAMKNGSGDELDLISDFAGHNNPDIALTALRVLASNGMESAGIQQVVTESLSSSDPARALAVVQNIAIDGELLEAWRKQSGRNIDRDSPAERKIASIYAAFLGADGSRDPLHSLDDLLGRVEKLFHRSRDQPLTRFHSALILLRAGNPVALPFLEADLGTFTVEQRKTIALAAGYSKSPDVQSLLKALLRDSSPEVRAEAVEAALERTMPVEFFDMVLEEILRPKALLKPWDIRIYDFKNAVERAGGATIARERAREMIGWVTEDVRTFGLIAARYAWDKSMIDGIEPFLAVDKVWQRRAAWYALGQNDRTAFAARVDRLSSDPSPKVRSVLPQVVGAAGRNWVVYFNGEQSATAYEGSQRRSASAPDWAVEALQKLVKDEDPGVRFESMFALLSVGEMIDPVEFGSTIDAFADSDGIGERVGDFIENNYQGLTAEHAFLLDYVGVGDISSYQMEEIQSALKRSTASSVVNEKTGNETIPAFVSRATRPNGVGAPVEGSPGATRDDARSGAADRPPEPVQVYFFTTPGCGECAHARDMLSRVQREYPRLQILERNIRKADSAQLNEALSEQFAVPELQRLVTPAVFSQAGYLIKDDIQPATLGEMLTRASNLPANDAWYSVAADTQTLAAAEQAIETRFGNIQLGVILGAGLLDGLNPCAFATIILFLSYLQIARRGVGAMLAVGIFFILGVFSTYFVLGLGLAEVIEKIAVLESLGRVLSYALAAFVLVIFVLNVRDGVLCLQGRLKETTLQLPKMIKQRVRDVVRTGARHPKFVIAAFGSGVIISVLELACTGQVYAPTIYYMVQSGSGTAVMWLLIYNLAFIAPLVLIFAMTFFGLRSDALIRFQAEKTATVKFLTAALFLVLFVVLVATA